MPAGQGGTWIPVGLQLCRDEDEPGSAQMSGVSQEGLWRGARAELTRREAGLRRGRGTGDTSTPVPLVTSAAWKCLL